jgi:hypothetical protein
VLFCAPSNIAVSNVVERLGAHVRLVHVAHPSRIQMQQYSLDVAVENGHYGQVLKDMTNEIVSCSNTMVQLLFGHPQILVI